MERPPSLSMEVVGTIGREVRTDTHRGVDMDGEVDIQPTEGRWDDLGTLGEEGIGEVYELYQLIALLPCVQLVPLRTLIPPRTRSAVIGPDTFMFVEAMMRP